MDTNIVLITLFLLLPAVNSLKDVRVKIPTAVRKSDNAVLNCYYDMEGDSLYSVKWYKGRREFYRYSPKENPAMKTFPIAGVHIVQSSSNESQIVLSSASAATSGKFSCEVSADSPSFHTLIVSGDLEVVEVPVSSPVIHGLKPRYKVNDIVRGNCTSKYSRPAANLTWTINDVVANPPLVRTHKPIKSSKNDLEISVLGLHFVVSSQHFINGRLKVKCIARMHDVYQQSNERFIEEERPRVVQAASSIHDNPGSIGLPYPYDHDPEDNEIDNKETYYTNIKGDASSLNAASLPTCHLSLAISTISTSLLLFNYLKFNYASLIRLSSS